MVSPALRRYSSPAACDGRHNANIPAATVKAMLCRSGGFFTRELHSDKRFPSPLADDHNRKPALAALAVAEQRPVATVLLNETQEHNHADRQWQGRGGTATP